MQLKVGVYIAYSFVPVPVCVPVPDVSFSGTGTHTGTGTKFLQQTFWCYELIAQICCNRSICHMALTDI